MIELLATIAVIVALIGLVMGGAIAGLRMANKKRAMKGIESLQTAVERHKADQLGYPLNVTAPSPMTSPAFLVLRNYNPALSFVDPWGRPYVYQRTGKENYLILSWGPDGQTNTADDITLGGVSH